MPAEKINKVRDCKEVTFNEHSQDVSLRSIGITICDGAKFRIPYLGAELNVKTGAKWMFLNKVTARKLYKFLQPVDSDQQYDYYVLKISPFVKTHKSA